jgi:ligand-binding sensor domain-containing protein/serine phosphatase RsbU (regulator of sigma subunit)
MQDTGYRISDTNCRIQDAGYITSRASGILHQASLPILFIAFLFSCFSSLYAQRYYFEFLTDKEGLTNPKVYSILQDENHLVWIGTYAGLSVFNGQTIKNYSTEDGLAPNGVKSIYKDSRGYIWFGHLDGGISRFDGKKFESRIDNLIVNKDITSFCEDSLGHLWITTAGSGAAQIFNPGERLENIKYEKYHGDRVSGIIFGCTKLHNNKLCFITDAGIKTFNFKNNHFENYILEGSPTYFQVTSLFEDKDKNLWIGTFHGGLYKYITKEKTFKIYDIRDGLSSNWISTIYQDKSGTIWVGHYENGGLTRIQNGNLQVYNQTNGLGNCLINCIIEDAENNLLIGTRENGLAIYKKGEEFVKFISSEKEFPSKDVWSILQFDSKRMWFGTSNGFVIYDPDASKGNQYKIKAGGVGSPTQIRYAALDKNKNIWIGTEFNEIFFYNTTTNRMEFTTISGVDYSIFLRALAVDQNNNLWIGTTEGLFRYDIDEKKLETYLEFDGLAGKSISTIFVDKNNVKYIGCDGRGLTIFEDSLTIKSSKKYKLLENTTPKCMVKDDKGNLWIGTDNKGVICFRDGLIAKRYTAEDGLLSDIINQIAYKDGYLYIGCTSGMNKINLNTGVISVYTDKNGFGLGAKNNAVCIDNKGNIWFGTSDGAIRYNTLTNKPLVVSGKGLGVEPISPKITNFSVNLNSIQVKPDIKLSYTENSITIEFISICITNPDEVEYKYMLEGDNNTWKTTKQNSVDYSALAPGKYVFKVIAKNYTGIWNSKPTEFAFTINPPFYETWWFISICIFIGLVAIFVYIQIRERNLVREKRVLEEKVKERTAEIVKINQELAVKNKDITDSIVYASRIQNALLPPDLPFDNTFVVFKPKDIVSGDFFWFLAQEGMEWFAAVDCTGHGVPGAFMSIIGHNSLNKILQEYNITKPSKILNQLNEEVSTALHHYHQDNQIHDGMDIALVSYDRENRMLEYSGAFNPLWLVRNKELIEVRANRYAIGIAPGIVKDFVNNEIKIESGDTIYLFSDGYADQFGGKHNKKMKIGVFKEIILSIQGKDMLEQKVYLDTFFEEWKKGCPQVDDVLVIGRRFIF